MCTRCSVFERFFTLLGVVMVKKTDEKEFSGLNECICSVWKQGNEETPETERPARFSRLCAATPACLGMEYIYEVRRRGYFFVNGVGSLALALKICYSSASHEARIFWAGFASVWGGFASGSILFFSFA